MKHRLLLVVTLSFGCTASTAPAPTAIEPGAPRPKIGADWFKLRADQLGISMAEAKARDSKFDPATPPDAFWNDATAVNTGAVWSALCSECHGGATDPRDAAKIPAPAAGWGTGAAKIFATERPLAAAFATIHDGGEDPKEMPPWGEKLAGEQIWALVHYIQTLSNTASARVHLEKK